MMLIFVFILQVIVCGQALSHTVNFTMRDLLLHWPGDKARLSLLTDGKAMSDCLSRNKIILSFVIHILFCAIDNNYYRLVD